MFSLLLPLSHFSRALPLPLFWAQGPYQYPWIPMWIPWIPWSRIVHIVINLVDSLHSSTMESSSLDSMIQYHDSSYSYQLGWIQMPRSPKYTSRCICEVISREDWHVGKPEGMGGMVQHASVPKGTEPWGMDVTVVCASSHTQTQPHFHKSCS